MSRLCMPARQPHQARTEGLALPQHVLPRRRVQVLHSTVQKRRVRDAPPTCSLQISMQTARQREPAPSGGKPASAPLRGRWAGRQTACCRMLRPARGRWRCCPHSTRRCTPSRTCRLHAMGWQAALKQNEPQMGHGRAQAAKSNAVQAVPAGCANPSACGRDQGQQGQRQQGQRQQEQGRCAPPPPYLLARCA